MLRLGLILGATLSSPVQSADQRDLPRDLPRTIVHSHNDYLRKRPVLDALEAGAGSLEADVYLVDGQLLVGHDRKDLVPGRTLQSLYLDPLQAWIKAHPRREEPLWLLVDVKENGREVYARLREIFTDFPIVADSTTGKAPVRIVLSGALASAAGREIVREHPTPWAGIDGRLTDLNLPEDLTVPMPWISESWLGTFRWLGIGAMPTDDYRRIRDMAQRARQHGRRLRFWGAPDLADVWRTQVQAGVDLLSTDRPAEAGRIVQTVRRESTRR